MGLFDTFRGWLSAPVGPAALRDHPPVERAGTAVRVNWPAAPYVGSGDLGPPGEWQMRDRGANDETLFAFGAVYACVQIISGDCGKLPIQFYDVDRDGNKTLNMTYPLNAVMRKPNNYQNRMQFVQALLISYLSNGNAYVFFEFDARNMVKAMHVLDPRACWPYIADNGAIYYRAGANMLAGIPSPRMIPARELCHIRLQFSPSYPLVGVSPIFAAAASSAVGQRILFQTQTFFGNGAQPGGVLTAPGKISDELAKRLREDFDQNYNNKRSGKTAVLGEGLDFKPLVMNATDAQLIEQLRWSVEDVARVFRMPPFMIGDQSKVTYRNSEQLARTYLNGCLDFHLSGIVEAFNASFELGSSMTMAFDLSYLLRTESDVRFDANAKAINGGFMTINEVRRQEGLPPMPDGDKLLVQGAMRSLEVIVNAPATGANPETSNTDKPASNQDNPNPETEPGTEDAPAKSLPYKGTWKHGIYNEGEAVTHDGALWVALRYTDKKPGGDYIEPDWKLAVKSGTNGKTPTFKLRESGILEATFDGGATWQPVGDMRRMFSEAVAEALKGKV